MKGLRSNLVPLTDRIYQRLIYKSEHVRVSLTALICVLIKFSGVKGQQTRGLEYAEPHRGVSPKVGLGAPDTLGTLWVDPVLAVTFRPVVPKSSSRDQGQKSCFQPI